MSTVTTIPSDGRFKSVQNGEKFGNIINSKNLSLDKDGVLALAKKAMVLYSLSEDAGFGNPLAIETDGTFAYIITIGHMYRLNLTTFFIEEVVATNGPTLGEDSDIVLFNALMHASGNSKINYLNALGQGQVWHNPAPITDLGTSAPHPLCVNGRAQTLLVGDGNVVRQYSTSYVRDTSNELTIPAEYIVTTIRMRGNTIYVGTRHKYGGEAKLFLWTGTGLRNQAEYGVGCDWIYSMTEYSSSIALIVSSGQILRFNGGGFDTLAALPVYSTSFAWTSLAADTSLIGKVANRGMKHVGDTLYMNLDGSLNISSLVYPGKYLANQPSGIWCLDPIAGLYHKAGYNYMKYLSLDIDEIASDYLVFSAAHNATTGDPFKYQGSSISGLTDGQVYYAIVGGPTAVRVSLSIEDAILGNHLDISGTPTTDVCFFDTYQSMGQTSITQSGGILPFGRNYPNVFYASEIIFGGSTIDEAQTAKGVLMSLGMGKNRGSFVTAKIPGVKLLDTYQKIVAMFEHLDLPTDSLVIKWRKTKKTSLPTPLFFSGAANWTSSTTFTVDTLLKSFGGVSVGDEIEVVEGAAGGYTAHITAIDDTTTTYTVTIDETMPVSTGQFDFVVDNWRKIGTEINNDTSPTSLNAGFAEKFVDTTAVWVQFKVELRGRNVMIEEMQSVNAPLK